MKKISEFLGELNEYTIYAEPKLSEEFESQTGYKACWPTHIVGRTSCITGLERAGHLGGHTHELCSYGYEIAESLEEIYAGTTGTANYDGRGSSFRAALKSIKNRGI